MEDINWAKVFESGAKKPEKKIKDQNDQDWLKYFNDFLNGFQKIKI